MNTRASRYRRPRRRYEDLCLATAVRRVQRDWLVATTDSEWTAPSAKASLLFATKLELARQSVELARARRWLSKDARREAEARARERFETIAAELAAVVPRELLRVDEMYPPEPVPGNPGESLYATYRRLGPILAAAAVFVALAMVIGLTGRPSENPGSDGGGPNHRGSAAAERKVGAVSATAGRRAPALEAVVAGEGGQARAYRAGGPDSRGIAEGLVVALAAWTMPAVAHNRDCSDFTNQRRAQRWFKKHHPHRDPAGVDRDQDGKACERNPCPCSHYRPRRDRRGPAHALADEQPAGDVAAPPAPSGGTPSGTTLAMPVAAPPPPAPLPASALTPSAPTTQAVRDVDQAAATAGVQTGLSEAIGGLTGGLDQAVGGAGDTLNGATGGLLGD